MAVTEFHWILDGLLAGSAWPGLFDELERDMAWLRSTGIRVIVNLTETAAEPPVSHFGFTGVHFPIDDMSIPMSRRAERLCREVIAALERSEPVLLHCKAGLGRTGTMLACCLIGLGRGAEEAIAALRRQNPRYIQTVDQERFVHHFAESFGSVPAALPPLGLPASGRKDRLPKLGLRLRLPER